VHKEAGQRSKIQGAKGLDLKDLLLLPSSPPSLPQLLVLIMLGLEKKKSNGRFSTHSLISPYFASLSLCFHPGIISWLCYGNMSLFLRREWICWLDPGTGKQGRDCFLMGKFGDFVICEFFWFVWLQT
jgi:hypothetical protein